MIVGTYLEEMIKKRRARQMAEAEEPGATRGRSDLSAELREWNARRLEAQAKDEPFDEPPPGLNG